MRNVSFEEIILYAMLTAAAAAMALLLAFGISEWSRYERMRAAPCDKKSIMVGVCDLPAACIVELRLEEAWKACGGNGGT